MLRKFSVILSSLIYAIANSGKRFVFSFPSNFDLCIADSGKRFVLFGLRETRTHYVDGLFSMVITGVFGDLKNHGPCGLAGFSKIEKK